MRQLEGVNGKRVLYCEMLAGNGQSVSTVFRVLRVVMMMDYASAFEECILYFLF